MFRTIVSTLAALALMGATSTTALAQQDLRMPDTRDAATAATQKQDLRGPDAADAARVHQIRVAMDRYESSLKPPTSAPVPASSDDTPWPAIAFALAAALALGAILAVGVMYLRRPSTLARS